MTQRLAPFPVTSPRGPDRFGLFHVAMSDGSDKRFKYAGQAQRFYELTPRPELREQLTASLKQRR